MTRAINAFDIEIPCHLEIKQDMDLGYERFVGHNYTICQQIYAC
jgi:hypothetical protein